MKSDKETVKKIVDSVCVSGDWAEFGVYEGRMSKFLLGLLKGRGSPSLLHLIDSFEGLAEPSEKDKPPEGYTRYKKGKFDVGGVDGLDKGLVDSEMVRVWDGWIPDVLDEIPKLTLSFSFIDLDHYEPTKHALEYAWDRTVYGGVVACHDYFPGRDFYATPAIDEFLWEKDITDCSLENTILWFNK